MRKVSVFVFCAAVAVFAIAGSAQAVQYTVGGWGPTQFPGPVTPPEGSPWGPEGYPGDTLELEGYTGELDLTPGTYVQKINTLHWTIDYTYGGTETDPNEWSDVLHNFTATRSMTIGGGSGGSVSQSGSLKNQWENDYLWLSGGWTTSFVVGGYQVDVTPFVVAALGTNFSGGNPWVQPTEDVFAEFVVSEAPVVPEPLTMLGLFLGLGSVGAYIRRRRMA